MSEVKLTRVQLSNILSREIMKPATAARVAPVLPDGWCWHCGAVCAGHKLETPRVRLVRSA